MKKRGIFLNIMLALQIIGLILGVWSLFYLHLPVFYTVMVALYLLISALGVYGLYVWKKWGIYVMVLAFLLMVIEHLSFVGWTNDIIMSVVEFGLLVWAYARKAALFS